MKQAIEELGLNSTRTLLEDRPRQLAQVGLVIARWAHVEQAMAFLFDYLLATARLSNIASKARNVLAHGLIHASDEYPNALVIESWNGMEQEFAWLAPIWESPIPNRLAMACSNCDSKAPKELHECSSVRKLASAW